MPNFHPWSADLPRLAGTKPLAVLAGASWDRWTRALIETLDEAGVAVASQDFLLVRVDSDLRPDVARRLAPSGSATLALLTPDGFPLAATTWAPPRSIREFLTSAAFQWKIRAPIIAEEAKKARASAVEMGRLKPRDGAVNDAFVRACVETLAETADPVHGGWGTPPRELNVAALRLLAERADIHEGREVLERTLRAMHAAILPEPGAFCHSYEGMDWSSPDGIVLPEEASELSYAFSKAGRVLNNGLFTQMAPIAEGWARARLHADPNATFAEGEIRVVVRDSSQAALRSVSSRDMNRFATKILEDRTDPVSGLLHRNEPLAGPFHLGDQAEALRLLTRLDPVRAEKLASALLVQFWDDTASAFRDRFGSPVELAPLDTAQFPVEENAIAAGALARLGGEWLVLAKRCLASFTDACVGQGVGAARLALAVQEVLEAESAGK